MATDRAYWSTAAEFAAQSNAFKAAGSDWMKAALPDLTRAYSVFTIRPQAQSLIETAQAVAAAQQDFVGLHSQIIEQAKANQGQIAAILGHASSHRTRLDIAAARAELLKGIGSIDMASSFMSESLMSQAQQFASFAEIYRNFKVPSFALRTDLLSGVDVASQFATLMAALDLPADLDEAVSVASTQIGAADAPTGLTPQAQYLIAAFVVAVFISVWESTAAQYPSAIKFINDHATEGAWAVALFWIIINRLNRTED